MRTLRIAFGGLLLAGALALGGCGAPPLMLPEMPLSEVTPYFGNAAEVVAIDTAYYQVKDADGKLVGTVLLTAPFAEHVKGYNGPTPLRIALDADNRILKVDLLANSETPRFAQRVADGGLYEAWDGLSVDEALAKDVDAISGATYTSNGVKNSLQVRLKAYNKQLTKEYKSPGFWAKLFKRR